MRFWLNCLDVAYGKVGNSLQNTQWLDQRRGILEQLFLEDGEPNLAYHQCHYTEEKENSRCIISIFPITKFSSGLGEYSSQK